MNHQTATKAWRSRRGGQRGAPSAQFVTRKGKVGIDEVEIHTQAENLVFYRSDSSE